MQHIFSIYKVTEREFSERYVCHLNIPDHYDMVTVYEAMRIIRKMLHHLSCHCRKHQHYGHVVGWLDFWLPVHLYSYFVGRRTSSSLFAPNGLHLKRIPRQWPATRCSSVSDCYLYSRVSPAHLWTLFAQNYS